MSAPEPLQTAFCPPSHGKNVLCKQCSFLYFRAGSRGGFEEVNENGKLHLNFPQKQNSVDIEYHCRDDLPDMPRLRASALAGCSFCGLLRESLQQVYADSMTYQIIKDQLGDKTFTIKITKLSVLAAYGDYDRPSRFAAISLGWDILESGHERHPGDLTGPDGIVYFKICAYSDDPLARYLGVAYPHPKQEILSAENVEAVNSCLAECDKQHEECARCMKCHTNHTAGVPCRDSGDPDSLPTRLIEIDGSRERKLLRLVDSKKSNLSLNNIKYATLSYRWGTDPFLETNRTNLEDHLRNIPSSPSSPNCKTSALPQGFKEVVDICWELGIRYLWIDSLCIIQKDSRDWARESSRMHKTYMNSWLTIVLASTDSPHIGILKRNVDTSQSIIRISYTFHQSSGTKGSFFIQPLPYAGERDYPVWHQFWAAEDEIDCSKWNTRGWTLQERLLSTRKLYIGVNDMLGLGLFSCRRKTNFGERDKITPRRHKSLDNLQIGASDTLDITSLRQQGAELYREWYNLVEDYSCRDLTEQADKLSAISGIARIQEPTLGDYIAGLWVKDLPMGLLWAPRFSMSPGADRYFGLREPEPFIRPKSYTAPSWSWCANRGQTEFIGNHLHNPKAEVEILGWECVPENRYDSFGRLAEEQGDKGYLKLRAKVKTFHMEGRYSPRDTGFQKRTISEAPTGTSRSTIVFLDHGDSCPEAEEVLVMIVLKGDEPPYYSGSSRMFFSAGLVLRKRAAHSRLECERIGFYEDFWASDITSVFDDCEPQIIYLV